MVLVAYGLLVVLVVFLSARLGFYVDLLDKKTTMASAFIGGVMLAAVTSLPELITSITSVSLVGKPELVIGNILGSNLFNVAVLGVVFLLYFKGLRGARVTASHKTTMVCVLAVYAVLAAVRLTGSSLFIGFSLVSLLIFGLYCLSIRAMSNDEDTAGDTEDVSPLSLRQVLIRFALYSAALIAASVAITLASDYIGEALGVGTTLAGALLLGIATSLPELITCFVLARIGNFNAMTGNIAGSNIFNFAILFVADLVYWNRDIYSFDRQGTLLIGFGGAACVAVLALVCLLVRDKGTLLKKHTAPAALLSTVPVACYAAFVVFSAY